MQREKVAAPNSFAGTKSDAVKEDTKYMNTRPFGKTQRSYKEIVCIVTGPT